MRGGAVSGFLVVALSLLGVWGIFTFYSTFIGEVTVAEAPFLIVGFGFGASFVALFAQLGGGIYTKAADVGSDLVGKVEKGIPEDDPRNAGVIADLVGDNVGDCAGRGADLFESTAAENIGAMILGVGGLRDRGGGRLAEPAGLDLLPARRPRLRAAGDDRRDLLRPRQGRRRPDEHAQPRLLGDDPVVRRGPADHDERDDEHERRDRDRRVPDVDLLLRRRPRRSRHQRRLRLHHPVLHRRLVPARSARSPRRPRPARRRTSSRAPPSASRRPPSRRSPSPSPCSPATGSARRPTSSSPTGVNVGGIFGTAVATMGMLMTTAYILAMDTFGPITDNAGGIAEFSRIEEGARHITDRLDAVGNTTKALTKGYAIASASLAAFLLFSAYIDKINLIQGRRIAAGVARRRAPQLGQPGQRQRVHRGAPRGDARLLLQLAGDQGGRHHGPDDHRRGPAPVPRDARDHGLQPAPGLRPGRRHHDCRRPPPDDPAGHGRSRHTRSRSASSSGSRRSPAC